MIGIIKVQISEFIVDFDYVSSDFSLCSI
jgi:hypothetical protein